MDIWRASLDEQRPTFVRFAQTILSSDEADRARRFHFERDRRRFIVGRAILRVILGRYLARAPQEIAFCYGENDKPALASDVAPEIHFNVAHCEGLALFAVTRAGEIGIDVECIRDVPEWEAIAGNYFDASEIAGLRACDDARRAEAFFRAWTRTEALIKARGDGLGTAARSDTFSVHSIEAPPGFVAALAVGPAAHWVSNIVWQGLAVDGLPIARHAAPTRLKTTAFNPISA